MAPLTLLRVFLPFSLGYFLSYLYRTVNAVIAPDLVRDVGLDPAGLGLLTSAYFLFFAAFQLPLGVLLDRFGPRRVEAALLLLAAVGAFVFARAETFAGLMLGRALIGLGVSACLMAAFKAFTLWFPPERLPLVNGVQMVSGGVGALAATAPVEFALQVTDWRGVFLAVAALTLLAAILVFLVVPEKEGPGVGESLREAISGIATVLSDRTFRRIAPWAVAGQAAYLSILGLWSGPWLRDVAGYGRMEVAGTLMGISLAMIAGYFSFGALADRLGRRGVKPMRVAAAGMGAFMGVQFLLVLQPAVGTVPLWLLFGFCGTSCILPYAALSQGFPRHLAGRANTGLNLPVFVAAFVAQWAIGAIIGLWPETATGGYDPAGYRAGFGVVLGLQGLAGGWYWVRGKVDSSSKCTT
ncbi:MFS transporter [Desulfuromonas sp.]|uniref:MFS transporter n=1 Tax=Desulfuromonas sp. TaxID=892 RepID=UPI0025BE1B46|nr:MFS transporter [Desulfuromonas sp.]